MNLTGCNLFMSSTIVHVFLIFLISTYLVVSYRLSTTESKANRSIATKNPSTTKMEVEHFMYVPQCGPVQNGFGFGHDNLVEYQFHEKEEVWSTILWHIFICAVKLHLLVLAVFICKRITIPIIRIRIKSLGGKLLQL